ncbi:putative serine/threonine protein kinase IRE [Dichanthelium oligosanthes]|uniref:non-specific serine/threonine protein kinase n=1 Tax=Dichanthelium oligosanthes TaxID=888268 RepID=A0A1E5W2X9_9POAL|nr:putative serine/threonine protein kinase IRE [Dichanthelium oligosanthes]
MSGPQKDGGAGVRGRPAMLDAGGGREMDSPRFRAILRATSGRRKRAPDVKSFSHELSAGGGVPAMRKMVRGGRGLGGSTAPEEFIGAIRTKFIRLKQEVDGELGVFAGDLVGALERGDEPEEDRRLALEDLLVAAQQCAEMSPEEFWTRCEAIVQGLDDRRQELPAGFPKQAHTRVLFILTRCTRLLQFRKEAAAAGCRYADDDGAQHVLGLHQLSDLGLFPSRVDGGDLGHKSTSSLTELKERLIRRRMLEHKHLTIDFSPARIFSSGDAAAADHSPTGRMASWKKLPSPAEKNNSKNAGGADATKAAAEEKKKPITRQQGKTSVDEIVERVDAASIHPDGLASLGDAAVNLEVPSQYPEAQQIIVDGKPRMICRICDFEIPMACAEGHFVVCTLADRCDAKGHTADQRLLRVAEVLDRVLASFDSRSPLAGDRVLASRASSSSESDASFSNADHDALSHLLTVPSAELFSEGPLTPASGSLPQSPLLTPRTSHAESQLTKHKAFAELENFQQIESLLAIARGIESIKSSEYNSLEDLSSYLEDLNAVIDTRKVDALVVETFGRRIAKLLQEKFMQLCGQIDDMNTGGEQLHPIDEDGPPVEKESSVSSRTSQALNGNANKFKDRTSIEDFEIIKPISRGAFGRVFLARKRVTGDLFAIKVLKKADMIRKNAVESILAERDILISARNPFVVRFFYSFTCRENLYLVMEYLNGGDLYSLLRNLGCLDEDMARTYIAELVLALEYLHSMNVIHRDLKPDNLLIGRDGHIKLTDFGLSKVGLINSTDDLSGPDVSSVLVGDHQPAADAEQREQKRQQRQKQTAVGTPDYLAPEILLGMTHGPTADWWSVGIILFELLVGIPPFNAEHPQIIFDNIMNREIPWPHVPEELSFEAYDLINKLLMENPVQRLGATGAGEVKAHPFFKGINWDMLARQKVAFIPSTDDEYDTSYFASRHAWGAADEHVNAPCNEYDDRSETSSMSCCSSPHSCDYEEDGDECGSMEEFGAPLSVKYSFSNFSFKNISQLASMNYDLITKHNEDPLQSSKS